MPVHKESRSQSCTSYHDPDKAHNYFMQSVPTLSQTTIQLTHSICCLILETDGPVVDSFQITVQKLRFNWKKFSSFRFLYSDFVFPEKKGNDRQKRIKKRCCWENHDVSETEDFARLSCKKIFDIEMCKFVKNVSNYNKLSRICFWDVV